MRFAASKNLQSLTRVLTIIGVFFGLRLEDGQRHEPSQGRWYISAKHRGDEAIIPTSAINRVGAGAVDKRSGGERQ
jgi:hypothetical protein